MFRSPDTDDSGFVLPFVLLATLLIMIGTATALGVVANNAVPARHSQDQETALAAAQAGVQAYVAQLDASCSSYTIGECAYPLNAATSTARVLTSGSSGAPTLTGAGYSVSALNPQGFLSRNNDDLRLLSKGCVPTCANPTATSTLLADVSGVPSVLRFTYFTNDESVDGALLNALYPARTITLSGPTAALVGATSTLVQTAGGSVSWPALANGTTCNQTWLGGRSTGSNDTATQAALSAPAGVLANLSLPCSVTFSSGMTFTGPVYSGDQLYVSNGLTSNSTGPTFSVPSCSVAVTTNCEPLPPASSAATPAYRSAAAPLGGTPVGSVQTSPFALSLPTSAADATASCTLVQTSAATPVAISFGGTTASYTGGTGTGTGCTSPFTVAGRTIVVQGNAAVSGALTAGAGQTSVVAVPGSGNPGNITITGDLTTTDTRTTNQFGEKSFATGSAIDLVATNDVILAHSVTCAPNTAPSGTTAGFCPNDISGLYTTDLANEVVNATGTLKSTHPARQYCNTAGDTTCGAGADSTCDSSTATTRTVDAAVFALNGSFRTDNYNRGCALGVLSVVGGVYENHRGPLGQEWETPTGGATTRSFSGYRLNLTYESLQYAGLPYVPALRGGTPNHPWLVVAVSSGTGS